eukprot:scaffold68145_cov33-Tisochrysis_lutea.AAC.1
MTQPRLRMAPADCGLQFSQLLDVAGIAQVGPEVMRTARTPISAKGAYLHRGIERPPSWVKAMAALWRVLFSSLGTSRNSLPLSPGLLRCYQSPRQKSSRMSTSNPHGKWRVVSTRWSLGKCEWSSRNSDPRSACEQVAAPFRLALLPHPASTPRERQHS